MRPRFIHCLSGLAIAVLLLGYPVQLLSAEKCEETVRKLNGSIKPRVDGKELLLILKTLNETDKKNSLPSSSPRAGRGSWAGSRA